ncbi:MAG: DUF885 domain-containing protein [Ilumatobacteraceae bacterium]
MTSDDAATALSPIFRLAERHVDEQAALDPIAATGRGIPGHEDRLTDFSPDGYAARAEHVRRTLAELEALPVTNDDDRRARDFIRERFGATLMAYEHGEWMLGLRAIASPSSAVRSTFDLMSRDGEAAWDHIATRVSRVPQTILGLQATLDHGRSGGKVAPRRQALAAAEQAATWSEHRWFDSLVREAEQAALPTTLVTRVREGAGAANAAYAGFAEYLRDTYAPEAPSTDGCGPERYAVGVRAMLGGDFDPVEMYEWAWGDFHELRAQIRATCEQILPGASFAEVIDLLDTDPARGVQGEDGYREWLQAMTDEALQRSHQHFEIPAVMDRCEALIPPAGSAAAAYYTGPSEDFSRPGRTWYPTLGRTHFPKWGDVTTCYHESVPGHHLQIAYAMVKASSLSRIQRTSFISGHGEGWALYAEQLCDEFGWFEVPDHRLGFLAGQMLRTVRVIIDIGMHLGMRIPEGTTLMDGTPFHGGEVWDADRAYRFSLSETGNTPDFMRSEIDRYLGWPAQAISYKIGQREWVAARDDAKARLGRAFDLRAWHTEALSLGAVGLGQLRAELAG